MRIVVYPHILSVGGSQLNAIELAAAVRDRGHHVVVFAARPGTLGATVERLGLRLVIAPEHTRRPSAIIARALRQLCMEERMDIVHGYEWPPCVEAFFGPRLRDRVAVGCTVMSMSVAPFIPQSVPLIVGTEQIAAAARLSRSGRVDVIEPPVDATLNHPSIDGRGFRTHHGVGDRVTLVLVSRLTPALKLEGLERTIAAAEILAPHGIRLIVVGGGPSYDRLAQQATDVNARTGEQIVTLTGELEDPTPAYAAADVVLGMGGSALRAMAFGKPVVVLGELGFADVLTPGSASAFLWQGFYGLGDGDTDPRKLATLLEPLIQNAEKRAQLGRLAREMVESRFSLTAAAERQERLYAGWIGEARKDRSLVADAARTFGQLVLHKTRRKVHTLIGSQASEDFNSIAEIAKIAALAPRPTEPN